MTRLWNVIIQLALALGQIWNLLEPIYPQHRAIAVAIIGIVQIIVSIMAQGYNPDGTPAAMPYKPK